MPDYEYQKRIPIAPTTMETIIKNHGYYDINSNWNSIVQVVGYEGLLFRGRVEVIVIKDHSMYMTLQTRGKDTPYRIPGGSLEKSVSNIDQARKEVLEEAKMYIKNLRYTGENYVRVHSRQRTKNPSKKVSWDGHYTEIFVAEYDRDYKGHIKESVYDHDMYSTGKFYDINEIHTILMPEHRKVLQRLHLL